MVKITELKEGDIVHIVDAGTERIGTVSETSRDENMACIDNGVQEFWYPPEEIVPVPLTEDRLIHLLGFEKEETTEGVKYKKGPFRIVAHDPGEQHVGEGSQRHRGSLVTALRVQRRIHREPADEGDGLLILL